MTLLVPSASFLGTVSGKGFSIMCKKIGIAAIVVVAGLLVLNKTKLGDWARYGWHRAKEAMNHSLPPEEEIKRLRYELSQLEPEMNKNMDALASERFASKELRKEVEDGRIALEKRFNEFKHAKNDLKNENVTKVSFDGRLMKKSDAEAAIASQWETYKTAEKTLKAKEKLLEAKEAQVAEMEVQVVQWKNVRDQMKAEIDRMEAECGCELPAIPDADTLRGRATRLLNCDDPPQGSDHDFCLRILSGNVVAG